MRVVQIIDELRPSGGAERLQLIFADAVKDEDIELTVVTLHENDSVSVRELEDLGVRVVRFASHRFLSPRRALDLVRFLRTENFDVVHTHLVRSTILGCLAGRAAGTKTVATLHNTRRRVGWLRLLLLAEAWVLRHVTDRIVAVGWETAHVHERRVGGREIEVIPNAVGSPASLALEERVRLREELGVPMGAPLVMAVGRLHPQKGFADLVRAFEQVSVSCPDARLCIAGSGQLRASLERQIRASGLEDRVHLLGLRRDVTRLLGAADVYVSSAHWEGLPIATLEAMAAGLPVVATRVGDVPRVVGPAMGTLVAPGRPTAIADALGPLLLDRGLRRRQGDAARAWVRAEYSLDAWATRLLSLYRELLPRETTPDVVPPEERRCAS